MAIKSTNEFAGILKNIEKQNSIEFLAELLEYAIDRHVHNDKNALDALVSVAMRTPLKALLGKVLRAAGVLKHGKISEREKPIEWHGIKVTHQLRAKRNKQDDFNGALAMVTADSLIDEYCKYELEKEAEKEEKKAELQAKKETASYWEERAAKFITEAAKHGIAVEVKVKGRVWDKEQKKA